MPPEKPTSQACLGCRSLKAKCDGLKPICGRCQRLGKECVYVRSMRGGSRVSKSTVQLGGLVDILQGLLQSPGRSAPSPCAVFDPSPYVQYLGYKSLPQVLRDYYEHLHASFPILPPERDALVFLDFLASRTPLVLAIQALTVLVPSILVPFEDRRGASAYFAAQASEAIEAALARAPPTLDVVQALYMLSVWNWGESGKPSKSRTLAVQALQLGMEMGLHQLDRQSRPSYLDTTWYKETCRRTWWSAFALHTTLSVVASTEPMIELQDHRLHTAYPTCSSTPHVWKNYVEAAQRCVTVTNEIAQLRSPRVTSAADLEASLRRLHSLDNDIQHLLASDSSTVVDDNDQVGLNLTFTARLGLSTSVIHLHRHQAFSDVAVYSRDTCGLQAGSSIGMVSRTIESVGGSDNETSISTADQPDLFESFIDMGEHANEDQISRQIHAPSHEGTSLDFIYRSALARAFPPITSMQRCAAAATNVAQSYQQLRWSSRSSSVFSPLCACGLVTAVYADILFALFTCAEAPLDTDAILQERIHQINSFHQILQEAGMVWSIVRTMADEVKGALHALIEVVATSRPDLRIHL